MRKPKYLSPTSVALFYRSAEEFYLKYLADQAPPKMPQTEPMSVGSAFDAFVKSYIYEKFYGKKDPAFELQTILNAQVEPQNRDFAFKAGEYCFECYKKYGALSDLMLELDAASEAPRMEFVIEGRIPHETCIDGVVLSGKPDIYFKTKSGVAAVFDWKVNGYCGSGNTSPAKGYLRLRGDPSMRGINQSHKDAMPMMLNGLLINTAHYLEQVNDEWANQISIYSWLLGVPVGDELFCGIDQIVCNNPGRKLRIAAHRCRVSSQYQKEWMSKIAWAWKVIESGHIFREMTLEESMNRQRMLDHQFAAYNDACGIAKNEEWFRQTTRQHQNF